VEEDVKAGEPHVAVQGRGSGRVVVRRRGGRLTCPSASGVAGKKWWGRVGWSCYLSAHVTGSESLISRSSSFG
jgi:hypothetical protein